MTSETEGAQLNDEQEQPGMEPLLKISMGQALAFFSLCNVLGFGNIDRLEVQTVDNYEALTVTVHRRVGPVGRYLLPTIGGHQRLEDVAAPPPLNPSAVVLPMPNGPYNDGMLEDGQADT